MRGQHRPEAFGDDLALTDEQDPHGGGPVGAMLRLVRWRPGRSTGGVLSESHRNFARGAGPGYRDSLGERHSGPDVIVITLSSPRISMTLEIDPFAASRITAPP